MSTNEDELVEPRDDGLDQDINDNQGLEDSEERTEDVQEDEDDDDDDEGYETQFISRIDPNIKKVTNWPLMNSQGELFEEEGEEENEGSGKVEGEDINLEDYKELLEQFGQDPSALKEAISSESAIRKSPIEIMLEQLNQGDGKVELTRQDESGRLQPASSSELSVINTKARIATTAQLLKNLSPEEKLQWALEVKEEGNKLYYDKKFKEAMEKYMEALSAADFGKKNESGKKNEQLHDQAEVNEASKVEINQGNINELVLPILYNLSSCCFELQLWYKSLEFSNQILLLNKTSRKAFYRKGLALFHCGEYKKAIDAFNQLELDFTKDKEYNIKKEEEKEEDNNSDLTKRKEKLSNSQITKSFIYMKKSIDGLKKEKEAENLQKEKIKNYFKKQTEISIKEKELKENNINNNNNTKKTIFGSLLRLFFAIIRLFINLSIALYKKYIKKENNNKTKIN